MRIYWGKFLKSVKYSPQFNGHSQSFHVNIRVDGNDELRIYGDNSRTGSVKTYEAETLEALYELLKEDGHQIWGYDDILDYACNPQNAFEYIMIRNELLRRGNTEQEIEDLFSLD